MAQYHSRRISRQAPCGTHETLHLAWGHRIGSNRPSLFLLSPNFFKIHWKNCCCSNSPILSFEVKKVIQSICFYNFGTKKVSSIYMNYRLKYYSMDHWLPGLKTNFIQGLIISFHYHRLINQSPLLLGLESQFNYLLLIVTLSYHRLNYHSRKLLPPFRAGFGSQFIL